MKLTSLWLSVIFLLIINDIDACTYTTISNGGWNNSGIWQLTSGSASCSTTAPDPASGGSISNGDTLIINDSITYGSNIQINNQSTIIINNGGTLDIGNNQFSTSWGNPRIVINAGGTFKTGSINFANGYFTNSGTITSSGNISFTGGSILLADNGYTFSNITASNVYIQNSGTDAEIYGRLNLTGNLVAQSGSILVFHYQTILSGYADFAGGQSMIIDTSVLVQAQNIYVENNSNLIVNGYLQAINALKVGLTPTGAVSGNSDISGSGTLNWGSLTIDPNNNYIGCKTGTQFTSSSMPPATTPPLNLTTCSTGTLSVTFVNFKGINNGYSVLLQWTTSSETNNDLFTIERAKGLNSWVAIGTVKGSKNSDNYKSYSFYDNQPSDSGHYYRIKQVDINGNISVSKILYIEASVINSYKIYPQPLNGTLLHVNFPKPVSWLVFSMEGTELGSGNFEYEEEQATINFSGDPLKAGIYVLRIVTASGIFQEKMIVADN